MDMAFVITASGSFLGVDNNYTFTCSGQTSLSMTLVKLHCSGICLRWLLC